jgi:hypothetical protein
VVELDLVVGAFVDLMVDVDVDDDDDDDRTRPFMSAARVFEDASARREAMAR